MQEQAKPSKERNPALSVPGLVLVGPTPNQIVCNSEAIRILTYPNPPAKAKRISALLNEKIPALLDSRSNGHSEYFAAEFTSGRRQYRCTKYLLTMHGVQEAQTVVILLERMGSPDVVIQEFYTRLHLTERERQAVGFLVRGLTSKEIAQEMGISPNTVKSFLRLVMTKVGVSTRTGLIGRAAGIVPRPQASSREEGARARSAAAPRSTPNSREATPAGGSQVASSPPPSSPAPSAPRPRSVNWA